MGTFGDDVLWNSSIHYMFFNLMEFAIGTVNGIFSAAVCFLYEIVGLRAVF